MVLDTYFVGHNNSSSALQLVNTRAVIEQISFTFYRKERLIQSVKWNPIPNFQPAVSYSGGALVVVHSTVTI